MTATSRESTGRAAARRSDLPLQLLLGSITVPLLAGMAYVLFIDLAASTKVTIALCIAAIAVPMAGLMAYIAANPPTGTDAPRTRTSEEPQPEREAGTKVNAG